MCGPSEVCELIFPPKNALEEKEDAFYSHLFPGAAFASRGRAVFKCAFRHARGVDALFISELEMSSSHVQGNNDIKT